MNDLSLSAKILLGIFVVLPLAALALWIDTSLKQWAWNTFMPYMFKLPTITFWQALAFSFLTGAFRSISFKK